MKYPLTFLNYLFLITGFIVSMSGHALDSSSIEAQANSSIKEIYHTLNSSPNRSMTSRINWISGQFLGTTYLLGALGEGPNARYDQFPLYRTDAFDCDTYVTTALSLALAHSLNSFQHCLKNIRYKNGKVTYINRNHFTSIDWNHNNQKKGLLEDITLNIKNKKNQSVAQFANALIDKSSWYAHKTISTIRLQSGDKVEQEKRLTELKKKGAQFQSIPSKVPYIPLTVLFSDNGKPNHYLFSQIPDGAVIEIVRPNWDLRQIIGTSLNISHLGFAIWIKGKLYFREASSQYGKVVDVSMFDYLKDARKSPTIKGINIQRIVPKKPFNDHC